MFIVVLVVVAAAAALVVIAFLVNKGYYELRKKKREREREKIIPIQRVQLAKCSYRNHISCLRHHCSKECQVTHHVVTLPSRLSYNLQQEIKTFTPKTFHTSQQLPNVFLSNSSENIIYLLAVILAGNTFGFPTLIELPELSYIAKISYPSNNSPEQLSSWPNF